MTKAVLAGLAVAAANVGVSWLATLLPGRLTTRYWAAQAATFFVRAAVLFGAATWWWRRTGVGGEVVVLILTGAIAQLIGQVAIQLRKDKCSTSRL